MTTMTAEKIPATDAEPVGMMTAILVPVLDRPHRIRPLVENIEEVTPEPHVIYFAAGFEDYATGAELAEMTGFAGGPLGLGLNVRVSVDYGDTWPRRINRLYEIARDVEKCDLIFTGADDLLFHEHWLSEAQATMSTLPDESGVVMVEDLNNPAGTMALIAVDYIERFGGTADGLPGLVMHPGYDHNWSDTELAAVALRRGRYARAFTSIVEHLHHECGKSPWDSTYEKGMAKELEDRALWAKRSRLVRGLS